MYAKYNLMDILLFFFFFLRFIKRLLIYVHFKQVCKLEDQLTVAENQCKNCRGLYKRLEALEAQLFGIQSERRTKLQELSQLR